MSEGMETNLASAAPMEHSSATTTHSSSAPQLPFQRLMSVLSTKGALFVFLVFVLGFIVRSALMRYELFFEFDSYWHARMISYILQGLPAPTIDPLAYYQNIHAATIPSPPILFWYFSAAIYKIFTLNGAYHFENWILWVKILPALYGALTCVAMYFLGKELFKGPREKTAGLFAGILAAVVPAYVYRTMGGFLEDDSFGFLWMVIGFVFFVRALRQPAFTRENIIHAVLGGVGFGFMALSWGGFNQLLPILLGVGFVQFWLLLRDGELEVAKNYAKLYMVSILLFAAFAFFQTGTVWLSQFGTIIGGLIFRRELAWWDTLGVVLFIFLISAIGWKVRKAKPDTATIFKWVSTIVILGIVLAPLLVTVFNVSFRTGDVLGQTVGEESEGRTFFGNKYSMMVVFALIGIPAIGYLLIRKGRRYEALALPLVWTVLVFFMSWGKLKFTYYWGLPLALTGMAVLVLGLQWMQGRSINVQKLVGVGIGFMLFASVAAGIVFVTQNVPNIESSTGWKEALFWSEKNLPEDAKFFNWWDEGHWISFLTNRGVLIDNRNNDTKATSAVAQFILTRDVSEGVGIVDGYGSTHLIFGNDLLEKLPNMGLFAYGTASWDDPRIQNVVGFVKRCSLTEKPLTREQNYDCGGNVLTTTQMQKLPTVWTTTPNNLQDGIPFFIYRDVNNKWLYAFSARANDIMLVRLWMDDPETMKYFTEVYRNDGDVRVYSVNPPAQKIEMNSTV